MVEPILIISGPTAAGKSALGLELAERLNGEIISCDSVLVYRGFDIGSAKPSRAERERVRHHLVDICEPEEQYHAARFRDDCLGCIAEIRSRQKRPIIVGGTTLYLSALLSGLSQLPDRDPDLREELLALSSDQRYQLLKQKDSVYASQIHENDTLRIIRALEIMTKTGLSIAESYKIGKESPNEISAQIINLTLPHEDLNRRIELRTKNMVAAGLLDEVHELLKIYSDDLPPFLSVGYAQAVACLKGGITDSAFEDEIVIATRQLAKRQRTFWRNEPSKRGWRIAPNQELAAIAQNIVHYSDQILKTRAKGIQRGFSAFSWNLEEIVFEISKEPANNQGIIVYSLTRSD